MCFARTAQLLVTWVLVDIVPAILPDHAPTPAVALVRSSTVTIFRVNTLVTSVPKCGPQKPLISVASVEQSALDAGPLENE